MKLVIYLGEVYVSPVNSEKKLYFVCAINWLVLWCQATLANEGDEGDTTKEAEVVKLSETDVADNSNANNDVLRKLLVSVITGLECPFGSTFNCKGLVSYVSSYTLSVDQGTLTLQTRAGELVLIVERKVIQRLIAHRPGERNHASSVGVSSTRWSNVKRCVKRK